VGGHGRGGLPEPVVPADRPEKAVPDQRSGSDAFRLRQWQGDWLVAASLGLIWKGGVAGKPSLPKLEADNTYGRERIFDRASPTRAISPGFTGGHPARVHAR